MKECNKLRLVEIIELIDDFLHVWNDIYLYGRGDGSIEALLSTLAQNQLSGIQNAITEIVQDEGRDS